VIDGVSEGSQKLDLPGQKAEEDHDPAGEPITEIELGSGSLLDAEEDDQQT
jgi:hypothetical protein